MSFKRTLAYWGCLVVLSRHCETERTLESQVANNCFRQGIWVCSICHGRVVYLTSIRYCICNNAVYIRSANKSFKSGQTYQSRSCLCYPSALLHSSGFDHIFWTEISVLLSTVLLPLRHHSCLVFHRAHCCTVSFVHYTISDTILNYSVNHQLFANENQLQKFDYQMTYKALQATPPNDVQRLTGSLQSYTDDIKS